MEEYPGNSRKDRERKEQDPKDIKRVVSGEVVRKKPRFGKRLVTTLFGGEDAGGVWGFIANDVLVPAFKDMVTDAVQQGVERLVFGEVSARRSGHRSRPSSSSPAYTAYNRLSSSSLAHRREEPRRELSRRGRATHSFDEIELQSRVEAEEVLSEMDRLLGEYETVTVADLYEMLGITGSHVDERFGWKDLRDARVVRTKGGYLLDLPVPNRWTNPAY